ncbi:MAG TPA: guanylate kinase [Candidatus Acidoferrales bacterium]|nr:guanylate kinase [Candidatus Acidoferrales bacterium]
MTRHTPQIAKRQGILFILSAPSGAGKTTLINGLRSVYPDIRLSVSCTTRARRSGEVNGRDYRFITARQFAAMKGRGEFAEWAKVHDFLYGTPRRPLDRSVGSGKDMVLDIDVQGARKIKRIYPQAVSVFLLPPSWRELQRRLFLRGTDGQRIIRRRLANARREIREIIKYDYYVVNWDVKGAVQTLRAIVEAERAKTWRVTKWRIQPLRSGTKDS